MKQKPMTFAQKNKGTTGLIAELGKRRMDFTADLTNRNKTPFHRIGSE
jgi:hypothetical protein